MSVNLAGTIALSHQLLEFAGAARRVNRPAFDQILRRLKEPPFSIAAELASGEQVAIETELGLLDVVQGLDGVPPYAVLHASAVDTEILGVKVAVCSIDALRQMKQAADRPRDRVDIEDLDSTGN
jgi:hypothetical protein